MPSHIQQFEYLHGAVLTALLRSPDGYKIRLVETDTDASRTTYRINDEIVHIKGSMSPRENKKDQSRVWLFTFTKPELKEVQAEKRNLVLVCAVSDMKSKEHSWRVLIPAVSVPQLLDFEATGQSTISVKQMPSGRKLRVSGSAGSELLIAASDILDWKIPG